MGWASLTEEGNGGRERGEEKEKEREVRTHRRREGG